MEDQPIVVLITAPTAQVGQEIAQALVEKKIAACANAIAPVNSVFHWQGRVSDEQEVLLVVKSRAALFHEQLVPAVLAVHPYEVPEIIALPVVMGLQSYLDWIEEETGGSVTGR